MTFGCAQNGPRLLSVDGIVVQNKLGGGGLGDGIHGGCSGQEKVAKEQMAKEKCKALEVKSAGTEHRHRRPSAQKLLQEGRAPKRRWRSKLSKWIRRPARNGGKLASCKARRVLISLKISAHAANAREDQPRTSVPRLSLRLSVNPPGRGQLH